MSHLLNCIFLFLTSDPESRFVSARKNPYGNRKKQTSESRKQTTAKTNPFIFIMQLFKSRQKIEIKSLKPTHKMHDLVICST